MRGRRPGPFRRSLLGLGALIACVLSGPVIQAQSQPAPLRVAVQYETQSGASLQTLLRGGRGRGALVYYLAGRGPAHPALIVLLDNGPAGVVAEVYQPPKGKTAVNIHHLPPVPTIRMVAVGGWWVRHGIDNYNLDTTVFDPLPGMVAALYRRDVRPGQPIYYIETRASRTGTPTWEADWLLKKLPGSTYPSFGFTESRCAMHWIPERSTSPAWPYVVALSGLGGGHGVLRLPIVVDWRRARIYRYQEFLGVHNQMCAYAFNSNAAVPLRGTGTPDFESPWGTYNLASRNTGYPNLIVHTFYNFAADPTAALPPGMAGSRIFTPPQEDIRYSWADHAGDLLFNYKVDLYGQYGYARATRLGSLPLRVYAPTYAQWPAWVMARPWPVAAFVQPQFDNQKTSEGIYTWNASAVGTRYTYGLSTNPSLRAFSTITTGYRGEIRAGAALGVRLYASPIDGRLHLLNARAGIWNLGGGWDLLERNLNHGLYLDEWERVYHPLPAPRRLRGVTPPRGVSASSLGAPAMDVESRLLALPQGVVLTADQTGVTWLRTSYSPSAMELVPPTNQSTWRRFTRRAAPFITGKSPFNLRSWTASWNGSRVELPGARLSVVFVGVRTFAVLVRQPPGAHPVRLPGVRQRVGAGLWIVRAGPQGFTATRVRAGGVAMTVRLLGDRRGTILVGVTLKNHGPATWLGTVGLAIGHRSETRGPVILASGAIQTEWLPVRVGRTAASVSVRVFVDKRVAWRRRLLVPGADTGRAPGLMVRMSLATTPSAVVAVGAAIATLASVSIIWRRRVTS